MTTAVRTAAARPGAALRVSLSSRVYRGLLYRHLRRVTSGRLVLIDEHRSDVTQVFGERDPDEPTCMVTVHDPAFYRRFVLGGSLGAAESYLRGEWTTDDLTSLIRLAIRNWQLADGVDRGPARLAQWSARLAHRLRPNSRRGARRNIGDHYDLSNEFFSCFLDETMMYSAAYFEHAGVSLGDASRAKLDRVCRKLALGPEDHVLEIGAGWGGFAEHAAGRRGCRITTTTISREQYGYARRRIEAADLADRATVLQQDYRDLSGRFDKLVSIEMIEAVGYRNLGRFFRKCSELLRPDGAMLLQAIVMPEQRYRAYARGVDFIQKYIFPGGCLPSVLAVSDAVARQTDMRSIHLEDLSDHYARTLAGWRQRFFERIGEVRELGFSERFIRMWEYYLCYCEAAFAERAIGVVQMVLAKPQCRLDPAGNLAQSPWGHEQCSTF